MKTPLRLAVLVLTTILFVFTYQTHNDVYSTSIPSRLILKSRGYLPQTFFGWEKNTDDVDDGSCSLECLSYEGEDDMVTQNINGHEEVIEGDAAVEQVQKDEDVEDEYTPQYTKPSPGQKDKIVIMGKMSAEYTDWVEKELPDWQRAIYHVDYSNHTSTHPNLTSFASSLPPSHYPTPNGLNKGREALPYLTYIIDNYNSPYLPSILAFVHPHRDGYPRAWHTDSPGHSMPAALQALKTEYIQEIGYASLRCNLDVGCPAEVRPLDPSPTKEPEAHMAAAWPALFPDQADSIPETIAAPCCAQFAVSRDAVRARPLDDYIRFRQWVIDSEWSDYVTGRVMEYLWHVIFRPDGADPVLCPDTATCYCRLYGRMCGRGRASTGPGRAGPALQAEAFEAVAVTPINTGPPPGVQGKAWFPQEHGSAWIEAEDVEVAASDNGEGAEARDITVEKEHKETGKAEKKEKKERTLPLPPPPVETPAEVEAGEIAATARALNADTLLATDPISWAKARVAAHNDLVDAKAIIADAEKANPAPPPRVNILTITTKLKQTVAEATVTTIPVLETKKSGQSRATDAVKLPRPHPRAHH